MVRCTGLSIRKFILLLCSLRADVSYFKGNVRRLCDLYNEWLESSFRFHVPCLKNLGVRIEERMCLREVKSNIAATEFGLI